VAVAAAVMAAVDRIGLFGRVAPAQVMAAVMTVVRRRRFHFAVAPMMAAVVLGGRGGGGVMTMVVDARLGRAAGERDRRDGEADGKGLN
jgi:hypothetical protein